MTGIIDQLKDPYFPQPKNAWLKGGYTAILALEMAYNRPSVKSQLGAAANNRETTEKSDAAARNKLNSKTPDKGGIGPSNKMDIRTLTFSLSHSSTKACAS
jgi:hypothetical protein